VAGGLPTIVGGLFLGEVPHSLVPFRF
jgi:hypothetical protein